MVRRYQGSKVDWKISIPVELALNIELLFCNAHGNKPDYGARSALVVHLLQTYWDNLDTERKLKAQRIPTP